ncbi:MAG TPA: SAM-dependent methyltransferase, partial [Casimicrobiaceae bacterium]|nr:SAM-dependent methyltransferase [Casimicrobiaceae bacterium]
MPPHRSRGVLSVAAAVMIGLVSSCATAPRDEKAAAAAYESAVASPIRTEQDRRMDASRHPAEFLAFVQAKPGMHVLDVSAGGGYTSQLLALAVTPGGQVWAQAP